MGLNQVAIQGEWVSGLPLAPPPPRGLTILLEVSSFDQCSMNTTDFIIKPGNKAQETQMIGDMFRKERDSQLYFLVSNSIFQCKQLKIKPGKTADGLEE